MTPYPGLAEYLRLLATLQRMSGSPLSPATPRGLGLDAPSAQPLSASPQDIGGAGGGPGTGVSPGEGADLSVGGRLGLQGQLANPLSPMSLTLTAAGKLAGPFSPLTSALVAAMNSHNSAAINNALTLTMADPNSLTPEQTAQLTPDTLSLMGITPTLTITPTAATASPGFGFAFNGGFTGLNGTMMGPQGAAFGIGPPSQAAMNAWSGLMGRGVDAPPAGDPTGNPNAGDATGDPGVAAATAGISGPAPDAPGIGPTGSVSAGAAGDGGPSGDSVICTELHRRGYLPDDLYAADEAFGRALPREILVGYHAWARPVARAMRRSDRLCRLIAVPALAWAQEMAYRMGVQRRGSQWGALIMAVGLPLCRWLGRRRRRAALA